VYVINLHLLGSILSTYKYEFDKSSRVRIKYGADPKLITKMKGFTWKDA